MRICGYFECDVKTFEPGLVPTIMVKSTKRSASGSSKEGILLTTKQFNFDLEDDDFKDMCRGFVPKNTATDREVCAAFPELGAGQKPVLSKRQSAHKHSADGRLRFALCRFSTEARKINGEPYPPKTLQHYLMGIQGHSETEGEPDQPNHGQRVNSPQKSPGFC